MERFGAEDDDKITADKEFRRQNRLKHLHKTWLRNIVVIQLYKYA